MRRWGAAETFVEVLCCLLFAAMVAASSLFPETTPCYSGLGHDSSRRACGSACRLRAVPDERWPDERWPSSLGRVDEERVAPNLAAYYVAIFACELARDWKRALRLLAAMRQKGILPDVPLCNAVIRACARAKQPDLVYTLLQEMWELGPKPDETTYSIVFYAFSQLIPSDKSTYRREVFADSKKDWALYLLADGLKRGLEPCLDHFHGAIRLCKSKKWDTALWLLREARREALELDCQAYYLTMTACIRGGEPDTALALMQDVRDCALEPKERMLHKQVRAYEVGNRWAEALSFIRSPVSAVCIEDRGHTEARTCFLRACSKKKGWEAAHLFLQEMDAYRLSPAVTAPLSTAYQRAQQWDLAMSLLNKLNAS